MTDQRGFTHNLEEKKEAVSVQLLRPKLIQGLKLLRKGPRPRLREAQGRALRGWYVTHQGILPL